MANILITGVSSGLGYALAQAHLNNGHTVYAIGQKLPKDFKNHAHFFFLAHDLSQVPMIASSIEHFIKDLHFHIVILNAGVLGHIDTLNHVDTTHIKHVMDINVWANKELIDTLAKHSTMRQVIGISSGASVNGSKGWGAYSLSKSALNMLLKVYAKELSNTHFTALAPGIIKTSMVDHIITQVDDSVFTSAKTLKAAHIQTPEEAAQNLILTFPKLLGYESGSFLDVRTMN